MQQISSKKWRFLFRAFSVFSVLFLSACINAAFAQTTKTLPTQIEVGGTPSDLTIVQSPSILGTGDFNGDQMDDLFLIYYRATDLEPYLEKFGIIFGKRNLNPSANVPFNSDPPDVTINFFTATRRAIAPQVALIGDVNGDHINDILFQEGISNPDDGGAHQYIFFGSTNWRSGLVELSLPHADIKLFSPFTRSIGGFIGLADINGDGIKDMIFASGGGFVRVSALLGPFSSGENIDFRERNPDAVFINRNNKEGFRNISFADVNGDGITDILAQAFTYNEENKTYVNSIKVIFGSANLKDGVERSFSDEEVDANIAAGIGYLVLATGDVNKDGSDDIVLSYPYSSGVPWFSGKVEIVFGSPAIRGKLTPSTASIVGLPQPLEFNPPPNYQFGDSLGAVINVQDFNGDGIVDILIGAPGFTANQQGQSKPLHRVYVILGSTELNSQTKIETARLQQDITFKPLSLRYALGSDINSGDFNGDGIADIFITAFIEKKSGPSARTTFIYFGGPLRRPEISEATYKKGSAELLIFGKEFTGSAQVEINGTLINRAVVFDVEKNQLVLQGSTTELNLQSGKNHLVIVRKDLRSDSFTFKVKGQ